MEYREHGTGYQAEFMGGGTENITIDGNYVHDTGWDGIWSGGDVTAGVDHKNLKVLNNTIENTGIGDVPQGRHPIYLQSQDPLIEGNTITGPRDGNGISIRSSGIVRCNNVSGTSRTGRPAIRYYSNHEVGSTNLLVIELNNVVSEPIGIDLYPPADRADGQSPPNHVVKNFIIRYNTVEGNPDIRVVSEYYDDPIYSVEVYDNPPSSVSPPVPDPTPSTVLLADFMNGNTNFFKSRIYLFNPSASDGTMTLRVFTLPRTAGMAQELTTAGGHDLGTLAARSALNIRLEDILDDLSIPRPYETDSGNLTLEITIQAADVVGAARSLTVL